MGEATLREIYRPVHDEAARHRFVSILKAYANDDLEEALAVRYEERLKPAYASQHGAVPCNRAQARPIFERDPLYQLWGSMVYVSQTLMWETVGTTCRRLQPQMQVRAKEVTAQPRGSLMLDSSLEIPEPIANAEIHRQPGGYFGNGSADDLYAAVVYLGTVELYRGAKGLAAPAPVGEPGMGRFILSVLKKRYPDLKPRRILDLGCGPGTETLAYAEAFPEAEVHALDLSAPFVTFGHAWAEDCGVTVHFRQADAQRTAYSERYFDLVVSHILFHETWYDQVPRIFAEAYRLLTRGGVFLNADVPYQPSRLSMSKQVTNDWQVRNNGEPFWTGFAETDVLDLLARAGFESSKSLAEYEPLGAGAYYFFGGRK